MHCKSLKKFLSIFMASLIVMLEFTAIMPSFVLASATNAPKLNYRAHVQDYGWDSTYKVSGNTVGTTGKSKRMEALEINLEAPTGVTLKYRAHVQDYGWMNWVTADNKNNTNFAGTTGKSKRVEALQISVEGLKDYVIKYRAHVQDYGWMDWVTASDSTSTAELTKGNFAGTMGEAKRMEAFEIVVVPCYKTSNTLKLTYGAHVQDYGWDKTYKAANNNGIALASTTPTTFAGVTGKAKRMEALEINVEAPEGVKVKYRAHVQDRGWMNWVTADSIIGTKFIGTVGESKRIEALQIAVEGLDNYVVKYRAHVEKYGWMDWVTASNSTSNAEPTKGNFAGTMGEAKRMEAFEIAIVPVSASNNAVAEQPKSEAQAQPDTEVLKPNVNVQPNIENAKPMEEQNVQPKIEYTEPVVESKVETNAEVQAQPNIETQPPVQNNSHVHSYTEWKTILEPTCISRGKQERKCETCDEVETRDIINPNAHSIVKAPQYDVEASCENYGKEYSICQRCNTLFFKITAQPLGHNWETNPTVDVVATCTKDGRQSIHCTRCSATKETTVIQKTGHNFEIITKAPTCTAGGTTSEVCSYCGKVKSSKVTSQPIGHQFENYQYNNDASCTKAGTETGTCTRCKMTDTRLSKEHPQEGHSFTEVIIAMPSCYEEGLKIKTCTKCETVVNEKIPVTTHSWKVEYKDSKCTGAKVERTCEMCGTIDSVVCERYGTGHTWGPDGKCTEEGCEAFKPTWTNDWSSRYFLKAISQLIEEGVGKSHNDLVWNHYSAIEERVAKLAKDAGDPEAAKMRHRIVWTVWYIADTAKSYGFNGSGFTYDAVITADCKFEKTAPAARPGFEFDGWYYTNKAGESVKVTDSNMLKNNGKTLVTSVDDMDKTFEARYK